MNCQKEIEQRLEIHLKPLHLEVADESQDHIGHSGAQGGAAHIAVYIVSSHFEGKNLLARHRLVYEAIGELMHTHIHALRIDAKTPAEVNK
ncbi:MAG: stress-induced morphogen [Gammaproteobacteria bacterium]|jgi:BolA protein|nr:stress-induced morphogen [Gammaproteobacteria bacterium]